MADSHESPGARRFPETHWSQILEIGKDGDPKHAEHLDRLVRQYWKPAYHYIRAMRHLSVADAEDVTQGFFTMMLSRVDFASLSPERGSFRGFLKTALRRFVVSSERKNMAKSRQPPMFPFAEAEVLPQPAGELTPEEAFDRSWAREVMGAMLERLRVDLIADGKEIYYQVFRDYCLEPTEETSYESLARRHGLKADDVRNYLRLARQRGREIMRKLIQDYQFPDEDVESELSFVLSR